MQLPCVEAPLEPAQIKIVTEGIEIEKDAVHAALHGPGWVPASLAAAGAIQSSSVKPTRSVTW